MTYLGPFIGVLTYFEACFPIYDDFGPYFVDFELYFLGISLTFLRISVPVSRLLKLASYVVELPRRGGFCPLFLFFSCATFSTAFVGENPS